MKSQKKIAKESPFNPQEINKYIQEAYSTLEQKYSTANNKRQAQLLKNFIHVLDRVSDQLIFAQEKFTLIDTEKMKNDKCLNYASEIVKYRNECYGLKDKIKKATFKLQVQKSKGEKLNEEISNLKQIYERKDEDLSVMKKSFMGNLDVKRSKSGRKQKFKNIQNKMKNPQSIAQQGASAQKPSFHVKLKKKNTNFLILSGSPLLDDKISTEGVGRSTRVSTFRQKFNPKKLSCIVGIDQQ